MGRRPADRRMTLSPRLEPNGRPRELGTGRMPEFRTTAEYDVA